MNIKVVAFTVSEKSINMYLQKPVDKEIQVNIEDIPTIGCSAGPIKVENRALQGIYTINLHDQEGSTAISTAKKGNGTIRSKKDVCLL